MIRPSTKDDIETIVSIWLDVSTKAHHFVPATFWESQAEAMKTIYIPNSETWVYETDNAIHGFASYYDGILAAIFVDSHHQSKGIGQALLTHFKERYDSLTLTVYEENKRSISFYTQQGFKILEKQTCKHTSQPELLMKWEK